MQYSGSGFRCTKKCASGARLRALGVSQVYRRLFCEVWGNSRVRMAVGLTVYSPPTQPNYSQSAVVTVEANGDLLDEGAAGRDP